MEFCFLADSMPRHSIAPAPPQHHSAVAPAPPQHPAESSTPSLHPAERVFSDIDTDRSGTIELEELVHYLLHVRQDSRLPPSSAHALIMKLDTDGDGKVSLEEWVEGWKQSLIPTPLMAPFSADSVLQDFRQGSYKAEGALARQDSAADVPSEHVPSEHTPSEHIPSEHLLYGIPSKRVVMWFSLIGLALVIAIPVLYALAFSTGWGIISLVAVCIGITGQRRLMRGQKRDVLPTSLTRNISTLWLVAALMAFMAACARCAYAAGVVPDFSSDLAFTLVASVLMVDLFLIMRRDERTTFFEAISPVQRVRVVPTMIVNGEEQPAASPPTPVQRSFTRHTGLKVRDECTCSRCGYVCCCWLVFWIFTTFTCILAVLSIVHSGAVLSFVSATGRPEKLCLEDVCISYECRGEMRDGAMIVVLNGFAASAPSYWFVREALSNYSRTCTYDPRGAGWSTWPDGVFEPRFGFQADASDVKGIFDAEFSRAGVPPSGRTAILASHSRGYLVAVRFHADYAPEFKHVVVVGYDGTECDGNPIDTTFEDDVGIVVLPQGWIRYGLAPIMPFLAGAVDLMPFVVSTDNFYAGQDVSGLPPSMVQILPREAQLGVNHRYTMARYWERNAITRDQWRNSYDGPSAPDCRRVANGLNGSHLYIPATTVCETHGTCPSCLKYCAGHVSLVQLGSYAKQVAARTSCFLRNLSLVAGDSECTFAISTASRQAGESAASALAF